MKKTKDQIDDVRNRLNEMVSIKDIELTDTVIVDFSQQLDELINAYIKEVNTK